MSVPALRQPKFIVNIPQEKEKKSVSSVSDIKYVILTLKDEKKLVVSSDAYHGVLMSGGMFKCVFCGIDMKLDINCKERHKNTISHKKVLEAHPHVEEFSENLLRKVNKESSYCTICNVIVANQFLMRHIAADVHKYELEKAATRASSYKPFN